MRWQDLMAHEDKDNEVIEGVGGEKGLYRIIEGCIEDVV
jgi:hypothetical protein